MVKTRIRYDQGVDEDFLSEKELNDFFETVVITGTSGRDDTELITTFDGYFPGRGLITAGSGIIVTTGTNFVEITGIPDAAIPALVGSDGITIVSGSNTTDIQGFQAEFVSASGSLQSQLDATVSGINDVFAIRLDAVDQTTYIGEADPGSLDSSPVWRIKRMIETGPDIAITWANGISDFNTIWDDRLSLSYS